MVQPESLTTLRVRIEAIRQHPSGITLIPGLDHIGIAGIKLRLGRIETRLEVTDKFVANRGGRTASPSNWRHRNNIRSSIDARARRAQLRRSEVAEQG